MSPESRQEMQAAPGIPPLNFIYACSICCATFADVYDDHRETVLGLSDGIHPKERLVSKLFLASCCHVFCSSHLENGGPPFHPAGQRPQAPCPVCIKEKNNTEPRDLYSLRGLQKDECDPAIPLTWFIAPPIRLDGHGKEMEALRFQYVALIRYCQNTYTTRKPLQDELNYTKNELSRVQDLASAEHAKVLELQQENERLRATQQQLDNLQPCMAEASRLRELEREVEQYRHMEINVRDFETFKQNKPAIKHYMKLVPMLIEQNEKMKDRLAKLGFAMALEPIPNFSGPIYCDNDDRHDESPNEAGASLRKASSSHTAGRSAGTMGNGEAASVSPFAQRPLKRQRLHSPLPEDMQNQAPSSRDAMPPPPKPVSRTRSMRKIFPALKKKFSHDTSSTYTPDGMDGNIKVYNSGHWQQISTSPTTHYNRPPTRHGPRIDVPYMSGGLPAENLTQIPDVRSSRLLSSNDVNDASLGASLKAPFSIRTNDDTTQKASPLQTEPSYLGLMDGLSRDNGLELGLKDPRQVTPRNCQHSGTDQRVNHSYRNQRQFDNVDTQRSWDLGHPFLHQSYGGIPRALHHLNPSQSHQASGHIDRNGYSPRSDPVTPAFERNLQSNHRILDVVSPFFKSHQQYAPTPSRSGVAESHHSFNYFGIYRSPRRLIKRESAEKREQRSLSGLSFNSRHNSDHLPYRQPHAHQTAESTTLPLHCQGRNISPQELVSKPEFGQSPYSGNNAYGSTLNLSSLLRHPQPRHRPAILAPPTSRSSRPYIGQLPSSMPSTIVGLSPVHPRKQWETLRRVGVKSGRRNYKNMAGETVVGSRSKFTLVPAVVASKDSYL